MWKRNGASNIYYNGGNVGIGTTNPSSKLDVNGMGIFRHALYFPEKGIGTHIRIGMDSAYWGYIASSNPYTGFKQLNIDAKPLVLNSDSKSGDVLIANGGGYVGIGTASPSSVLEINDTSSWETSFQIDNSSVSPKNNWQLNVGGSNNSLIGSDAFGIYDGTISNSYRFVIDTGGRIGLGTTSPTYNLQIAPKGSNGGSFMIGTNSATGGYTDLVLLTSAQKGGYCEISSIKSAGSAYGVLTLNPKGGNVGIGTYSPSEKLSVSGNICYTGSIGSCSDRRYKTNILSMGSMLSNVMALAPVTYNWKVKEFPDKNFNDKKQLGFIAQDIEKIFPELVLTDQDGYKSVDYVKITPILVKAVQEQQSEIEALKKQNEQILAKLNSLEAGNNKASASIK